MAAERKLVIAKCGVIRRAQQRLIGVDKGGWSGVVESRHVGHSKKTPFKVVITFPAFVHRLFIFARR